MKTRESGMPPEETWETFFNPGEVLHALGLRRDMMRVVDLGCGYGTFTLPAARLTAGTVHAFDIEQAMVDETRRRAEKAGIMNVKVNQRDFIAHGTGLSSASVDYVMLYNILHAENPRQLLADPFRILDDGGILGIMHWNHDRETPRGPPMEIRPRPEQCARWAEEAGFTLRASGIDLPPYHYGVVAEKRPMENAETAKRR